MLRKTVLAVLICGLMGVAFGATNDDFAFKLVKPTAESLEVTVVGEWDVDGIQGWSYGVCHDANARIGDCMGTLADACTTCPELTCPNPNPGPTGQGIDFNSVNMYQSADDGYGFTQGAVLSFMQAYSLSQADSPFAMLTAVYTVEGDACVDLNLCSTLGAPSVETTIVVGGASFNPTTQEGTEIGVCTGCEDGTPMLSLGAATVEGAAPQTASVPVMLDTYLGQDVSGFQFGVALNTADAVVQDIVEGAAVTAIGGADFFGVNIVDGGATLGCAIDLEPEPDDSFRVLPNCTMGQEIAVAMVGCAPGAPSTVDATLALTADLGDPPVALVVDVDGTTITPDAGEPVSFQIECGGTTPPFVRTDVNQDGDKNVSDGVAIAKAVFGLGDKYPLIEQCMDAADADDDEDVDMGDAIYLLEYLFLEGPMIPAPADDCGQDPTPGDLGCIEYAPCN